MKYASNPDTVTRDYFDSLLLETRYIDSKLPSTKMELFGEEFDTPIMTAALSHLHNPADGMAIYGKGAAMANAVHCPVSKDIPENMKSFICAAYDLGYIKGTVVDEKLCFLPQKTITRAEAAVMLSNMLDSATPTYKPSSLAFFIAGS